MFRFKLFSTPTEIAEDIRAAFAHKQAMEQLLEDERIRKGEQFKSETEQMEAFRKVGETFNYIGLKCVVLGYYDPSTHSWPHPLLVFRYADFHGVLRKDTATIDELPGIIAQNPTV